MISQKETAAKTRKLLDDEIESMRIYYKNATEKKIKLKKKINEIKNNIKEKQIAVDRMEKWFNLVVAKYNKFLSDINAVRDYVDKSHLELIFDKFSSDSIFDVEKSTTVSTKAFQSNRH